MLLNAFKRRESLEKPPGCFKAKDQSRRLKRGIKRTSRSENVENSPRSSNLFPSLSLFLSGSRRNILSVPVCLKKPSRTSVSTSGAIPSEYVKYPRDGRKFGSKVEVKFRAGDSWRPRGSSGSFQLSFAQTNLPSSSINKY